jgi:hypothetical protein
MVRVNARGYGENVSKPASILGKLGLSLFFAVFFAMGSFFEIFIIHEFTRAMSQRSWTQVPCTVVASEVQERSGESAYVFAVRYQYGYGGQRFDGSTYRRSYTTSGTYSDAQALVQRYSVAQAAVCYVNPNRPAQAVLERDSLLIGLVGLVPLVFILIGAGGLYFTWRKSPPAKAKRIAPIARSARKPGKYTTAAFFALFAIVGGAMLYPLGIRPIARTLDAASWTPTPCKVLRAEVRSHDSDDGTTYSVHILYQYECNGQTYKSDRYDFIGGSSSGRESKARIVEQYRTAANPVCYVNPKNPSEAVLKRGFHAKLLLALFPLPFLLVGVIGVVQTLRGKKDSATFSQKLGAPPSSRAPDPLSLLRPGDASPATLKPRFSARGKLVGAIVVAVFWNGIVSIFVVNAPWFMMTFLLPFIAVGVGMIGFVIYQFLALFNPVPTLDLSSRTIPLGGGAELQWSFSGQTSRIRELTVTLRGVERATYRKGTSTCTDESTFYELELYRTTSLAEISSGQVGFILPQDTMHSFIAANNKIVWSIDLRGDIKSWPDVKESFEIEVTPAACGRQDRHG